MLIYIHLKYDFSNAKVCVKSFLKSQSGMSEYVTPLNNWCVGCMNIIFDQKCLRIIQLWLYLNIKAKLTLVLTIWRICFLLLTLKTTLRVFRFIMEWNWGYKNKLQLQLSVNSCIKQIYHVIMLPWGILVQHSHS